MSSFHDINRLPGKSPALPGDPPEPADNPNDKRIVSNGGAFYVIGSDGSLVEADLGTLMMMICLKRTENLDKQIAMHLDDIQKRNQMISLFTEAMSEARRLKGKGLTDKEVFIGPDGKKTTLRQFMKDNGIPWVDIDDVGTGKKGDDKTKWDAKWDANINNIKSRIDILNNDSQMANIKLQNILEKRNNSFEMTTKVMQTNNSSVQSIIRNL